LTAPATEPLPLDHPERIAAIKQFIATLPPGGEEDVRVIDDQGRPVPPECLPRPTTILDRFPELLERARASLANDPQP
jgi:hypothetical protein